MAGSNLSDIVTAVGDLPATIQDIETQLTIAKTQAVLSMALLVYIAVKVSK